MDELQNFRHQIEQIDEKIVALLNDRCELSQKIGKWKKSNAIPVQDRARETDLLNKLKTLNRGILPDDELEKIYQAILSCSRALQK